MQPCYYVWQYLYKSIIWVRRGWSHDHLWSCLCICVCYVWFTLIHRLAVFIIRLYYTLDQRIRSPVVRGWMVGFDFSWRCYRNLLAWYNISFSILILSHHYIFPSYINVFYRGSRLNYSRGRSVNNIKRGLDYDEGLEIPQRTGEGGFRQWFHKRRYTDASPLTSSISSMKIWILLVW